MDLNSTPIGHPPTNLHLREKKLIRLEKRIRKKLEKGLKVMAGYFDKFTRD
jgi:hypothetical protein